MEIVIVHCVMCIVYTVDILLTIKQYYNLGRHKQSTEIITRDIFFVCILMENV